MFIGWVIIVVGWVIVRRVVVGWDVVQSRSGGGKSERSRHYQVFVVVIDRVFRVLRVVIVYLPEVVEIIVIGRMIQGLISWRGASLVIHGVGVVHRRRILARRQRGSFRVGVDKSCRNGGRWGVIERHGSIQRMFFGVVSFDFPA